MKNGIPIYTLALLFILLVFLAIISRVFQSARTHIIFGGDEPMSVKLAPITSSNFDRVIAVKSVDAVKNKHVSEVLVAMAKASYIADYKQRAIYLGDVKNNPESKTPYGEDDENGAVIGYISFGPYNLKKERNNFINTNRIFTIIIDDKYRGKKYGETALKLAIDEIKKDNNLPIILTVVRSNIPAKKVYERIGFEDYTTKKDKNSADYDIITMKLK